jgi:hypothetical protein
MPDRNEDLNREIATLQVSALQSIQEMVIESEASIKSHHVAGKQMMEEAVIKKQERKKQLSEVIKANGRDSKSNAKGKGRANDTSSDESDEDDHLDGDDEDIQVLEDGERTVNRKQWKWWLKTDNGKTWKHRHTALQGRKRENLVVAHKVQLLLGDTYFQLKEPDNEKKYYDEAEGTRLLLLNGKCRSSRRMTLLTLDIVSEKAAIESMKQLPEELSRIATRNTNDPNDVEAPTFKNLMIDGPPDPGLLTDLIVCAYRCAKAKANSFAPVRERARGHRCTQRTDATAV